jgi:hypothetical protein
VRAHPLDVAPELVSELETRSQAFMCSRCSFGPFRRGSRGRHGDMDVVMGVGISDDVTDVTAPS